MSHHQILLWLKQRYCPRPLLTYGYMPSTCIANTHRLPHLFSWGHCKGSVKLQRQDYNIDTHTTNQVRLSKLLMQGPTHACLPRLPTKWGLSQYWSCVKLNSKQSDKMGMQKLEKILSSNHQNIQCRFEILRNHIPVFKLSISKLKVLIKKENVVMNPI